MRKIIFFSGAMGRGGAERVISILSEAYIKSGWDVSIALLLHSNVDYELNQKVKVLDLSDPRGIRRGAFNTLRSIRRLIRDENPDVIVTFMAQNCLLVGLSAIGLQVRSVMSERIDPSQVRRNIFYKKVLDWVYGSASAVVFQTMRAKGFFNKRIQENSVIIGNPVSVNIERAAVIEHRIVTAGRMTEQKNQKMLISAFSKIAGRHPEYSLTIYGEGPLRPQLTEQIRTLKLTDRITLPGNVPNLHKQISNAEIFVLPSDFEGLSNAFLEAMMMGLPVIATDCAGCDEVIVNGHNGILINVGDESALIRALESLISDKKLRAAIAKEGKSTARKFQAEHIVDDWKRVINGDL